jgi:glycine hydroxymethyltransferase
VTTQGMGEPEMARIAELIGRAVTKTDGDPDGAAAREIRGEVRELVGAFPAYPRG